MANHILHQCFWLVKPIHAMLIIFLQCLFYLYSYQAILTFLPSWPKQFFENLWKIDICFSKNHKKKKFHQFQFCFLLNKDKWWKFNVDYLLTMIVLLAIFPFSHSNETTKGGVSLRTFSSVDTAELPAKTRPSRLRHEMS